jgi:hypothetical protein
VRCAASIGAPSQTAALRAAVAWSGKAAFAAKPAACALARCLILALMLWPGAAEAGWLGRLLIRGAPATSRSGATLESIAALLKAAPPTRSALAAEATPEGHWRFLNPAGEILTAGTPEELARVASILLPDARPGVGLALYVSEDTIFLNRDALAHLPKGSELNVVVARESYAIVRRSEGQAERLFAEVRSNLIVEMNERAAFEEAVWQLARPLAAENVRVLALEPGGPPMLASSPRIDPASKRALIDTIDPASLPAALGTVRGQTLLVTGRIDGRLLSVQPASGTERSIIIADLLRAAEEADVNLVVLHAATPPRQPGGRNWLWQKVEVDGLDRALQRARLADFFNALGTANRPLLVTAVASPRRTSLTIAPLGGGPASAIDVGGIFSGLLSQITGRVAIAGVTANLRSAEREEELAGRFIPRIPADLQAGYLMLLVLGLLGVPWARAWWHRLWPPEIRAEYAGLPGYIAAVAVRGLVFLLLYLPLSACVGVPYALVRLVRLLRGDRRRAAPVAPAVAAAGGSQSRNAREQA